MSHLRVRTTVTASPGHLAVVTGTGRVASVTSSAGYIWAMLAGLYGQPLMLPPGTWKARGTWTWCVSARVAAPWTHVWPAPEDNPRHRDLEAWMAAYGHQIVSGE